MPIIFTLNSTLTILNLRGVRQTSFVFIVPTIIFILCIVITIVIGLVKSLVSAGHPYPVIPPTEIPEATATINVCLLLGAFANGLTAKTGVVLDEMANSTNISVIRQDTSKITVGVIPTNEEYMIDQHTMNSVVGTIN